MYRFWDNLIAFRNNKHIEEIDYDVKVNNEPDNGIHPAILTVIDEYASAGYLSRAEQNRFKKMASAHTKVREPKYGIETLDQIKVKNGDLKLQIQRLDKDLPNVFDKSIIQSRLQGFDQQYIKDVLHRDVVAAVMCFQNNGVIVKDISISTENTVAGKTETYKVYLQPINGPSSIFTFTFPVVDSNGSYKIGGTLYRMEKQCSDMPIIKLKPDVVNLTSYYPNKIYANRSAYAVFNYSKWIIKQILNNSVEGGIISRVTYGITIVNDTDLPREYSAIMNTLNSFVINSTITGVPKDYYFYFNYNRLDKLFSVDQIKDCGEQNLVPCGYDVVDSINTNLLAMDEDGIVYVFDKGFTALGALTKFIDPNMKEGIPEYVEMDLLNCKVPIIFVLTYLFGFDKLLRKLNIDFTVVAVNTKVEHERNQLTLKFKDGIYVLHNVDKKKRLLFNGFYVLRNNLSKLKGNDFNNPRLYTSLLSGLDITLYHLREIKLLNAMFIDPITMEIIEREYPNIDFYKLLLITVDLLATDKMPISNPTRFKGYERLVGFLYKEMVNSLRIYNRQGSVANKGISVNPRDVLLKIINDQSNAIIEQSNPIHELKEQEAYTHTGAGGKKVITMTKKTRSYNHSDIGIVSESTPDSSKSAVRAFLTANPNIVDLRGTTREYNPNTDGASSIMSTTAVLAPMITHDDGKRVNYASIMNSHTVSCNGYTIAPYSTGGEEFIGHRSSELYIVKAKQPGIVVSVKPTLITVEYKDESIEKFEVGIKHGIVSGTVIPHTRICDLKEGHVFKSDDILIYDEGFFQRSLINPQNVALKFGVICRTALLENSLVMEDGCVLSSEIAKKLITPVTKMYSIILDFNTNVHNLIALDTEVNPDSILCIVENDMGEATDEKNNDSVLSLAALTRNTHRANTYGTVTNIEIVYFGEYDDMSKNLLNLVHQFETRYIKRNKSLSTDAPVSLQIKEPIMINKIKLEQNQVAIKFYIDGELDANDGDKFIFGAMIKSTCSEKLIDPIISAEDNQTVDAMLSYQSPANRIVESPERGGMMNTIMMALSKQLGEKLLEIKL
jgi:hypothetical protein